MPLFLTPDEAMFLETATELEHIGVLDQTAAGTKARAPYTLAVRQAARILELEQPPDLVAEALGVSSALAVGVAAKKPRKPRGPNKPKATIADHSPQNGAAQPVPDIMEPASP